MMGKSSFVKVVVEKYKNDGLLELLKSAARVTYCKIIRPYLPGERQNIRGIKIRGEERKIKAFDSIFGVDRRWPREHKKSNCRLIKEYIYEGDNVTVVGGGFGISTVKAAEEVGPSGQVLVYEGAENQISPLKETLELNSVDNITEVRHGIVGEAIDLKHHFGCADTISPDELFCDALELDCEGAEAGIIGDLSSLPDRIIVETHPKKGASTLKIKALLEEKGYEIVDRKPDRSEGHVLVAKLK